MIGVYLISYGDRWIILIFSEINEGRRGGLCWVSVIGAYLVSIGDKWTISVFCCRLMHAVGLHLPFLEIMELN